MVFAKYISTAKISWSSGFIYRFNFVMWRVRNVLQILAIYFLWLAILKNNPTIFNYSSSQMLTYVLGTSIIRALVFSSKSVDAQGEISSGDLNNYLVKPLNYFRYWFSRDLSDKLLNILFVIVEVTLLYFWLQPAIFIQTNPTQIIACIITAFLAMIMYFYFSFIISLSTFWIPEGNGWPQRFLIFVMLEFLAGGLFPLDILPKTIYTIIHFLPSTYFLNVPLQIYLGRTSGTAIVWGIVSMIIWVVILERLAHLLFQKGLKIYGAYGR